jgi:PEP-CTERM motif
MGNARGARMQLHLGELKKPALAVALCAAMGAAQAAATALPILSDGTWKATDTFVAGWQSSSFNDSAWGLSRAPYPSPVAPTSLIAGTPASFMWYDPTGTSDGTTGAVRTWYRKSFFLDLSASGLPVQGQALISVDDDFEFYVNGNLAYRDASGGNADVVHVVDFSSLLVNGTNTFALYAVDGDLAGPYDRIYERVLFDAAIRSTPAVPEPSTVVMLFAGLIGVGVIKRRGRRI